ncbi:MAG: sugar transferase [Ardenticatenales bacterium]|nr:sugar transferase [Ardenticatenales bacterium]
MIAKRVFDLVTATVCLILSSPLFAVIAILIKLDSPGSAMYLSQRVGRYGNLFGMVRSSMTCSYFGKQYGRTL